MTKLLVYLDFVVRVVTEWFWPFCMLENRSSCYCSLFRNVAEGTQVLVSNVKISAATNAKGSLVCTTCQ